MLVISMKASKKKILLILAGLLILLAVILFFVLGGKGDQTVATGRNGEYSLAAEDAAQRTAFLEQFGWTVNETPLEQVNVILPSTFNEVYENYNQIQKEQGLDLLKHAGRSCQRYTYQVTNYPGRETGVIANLLILDGRVIGGDICSVELNGFIHGFANPNDAPLTQLSPGEASSTVIENVPSDDQASQVTGESGVPEEAPTTALETISSEAPLHSVESSTERETLAPDPEMPNAPVD